MGTVLVHEKLIHDPIAKEIDHLKYEAEVPNADPETIANRFSQILSESLASVKSAEKKNESFYDEECKFSSVNLDKMLHNVKNAPDDESKIKTLTSYRLVRKEHKKLIKRKKENYKRKEKATLLKCFRENNSREFWKIIKRDRLKDRQSEVPAPETWPDYFKLLQEDTQDSNIHLQETLGLDNSEETSFPLNQEDYVLCDPITPEEIEDSLNKIRGDSAPGPDGIPMKIFKAFRTVLLPFLVSLFNLIISKRKWPMTWKTSLILPLYKNGNPTTHNNYRPISLLNSAGKVLEKIIDKRLGMWIEEKKILQEEQGGFRPGYSTADRVFVINALVEKHCKGKGKLYVALIDLKSAFDSVDRVLLLNVLLNLGLPAPFLQILSSMYSLNKSFVKVVRKGISLPFFSKKGVRQGSTFSPKLFAMFINDIVPYFRQRWAPTLRLGNLNMSMLLFADDIILLAKTNNDLQTLLNLLEKYLQEKKLEVNVTKSQVMIFSKKPLESAPQFLLNGKMLEVVEKAKYLGFILCQNGKWTSHITTMAQKGRNALFGIYRSTLTAEISELSLHKHIFNTKIMPILHYGSEIWGYQPAKQLETLQLQYYKRVFGLHNTTHTLVLKGDLGIFNLKLKRYTQIIKFWLRLLELPQTRLARAAYEDLLLQCNKTSWTAQIKRILDENGFSSSWEKGKGPEDHEKFFKEFSARLEDQEVQLWQAAVDKSPSLTLYREVKENFGQEFYFKLGLPIKYLRIWIQIRANCLPIYTKVARKKREGPEAGCSCLRCGENDYGLGHFLLRCKQLSHLRGLIIQEGEDRLLCELMRSRTPRYIVAVGNFVLMGRMSNEV